MWIDVISMDSHVELYAEYKMELLYSLVMQLDLHLHIVAALFTVVET